LRKLRREVARQTVPGDRIVGKSPGMLEIFKTIGRVASRNVSVLVTGESGTGKELVAQAIHAASPRSSGLFVPVNTTAIPRDLLESELFGHERGAFTGAILSRVGRFREASGGTLFLDEIGDMPVDLQAKLLRVLQDQVVTPVGAQSAEQVDVRIIATTHRDLDALVTEGLFREDLLYRLRVMPLHMPALRERPEDIPILAEHFTARYAEELAGGTRYLTESTVEFLCQYAWPGNVRELENAIKRALVLGTGEVLDREDFAFLVPARAETESAESLPRLVAQQVRNALESEEAGDIYRAVLEQVERPLLEAVLDRTNGNQVRAAAVLGINRNTLRKKIRELGISVPGRV
jgi:two-component system nitrogen regulation response regulator GlnG